MCFILLSFAILYCSGKRYISLRGVLRPYEPSTFECAEHGLLNILHLLSDDSLPGYKNYIVTRSRLRIHESVAFSHEPSGPVSHDAVPNFLAGDERNAGTSEMIFPVQNYNESASPGAPFFVNRIKVSLVPEYIFPEHK